MPKYRIFDGLLFENINGTWIKCHSKLSIAISSLNILSNNEISQALKLLAQYRKN